jgi:hypothetical protein
VADRSSTSTSPPDDVAFVWTFQVTGDPLVIEVPKNPPLCHQTGGPTLWKYVGTKAAAAGIADLLEEAGMGVSYGKEEVTPEMEAAPRPNIDEYEFRTDRCPLCYFFDPEVGNQCGWESWPDERLDIAYGAAPAQQSIKDCPLHKGD